VGSSISGKWFTCTVTPFSIVRLLPARRLLVLPVPPRLSDSFLTYLPVSGGVFLLLIVDSTYTSGAGAGAGRTGGEFEAGVLHQHCVGSALHFGV
jgi:hypothetical protein